MAMSSPSVQSSSFSNYSSGPTPGVSSAPTAGSTEWFKEHGLIILVIGTVIVAVIWYLTHRAGTSQATLDNSGYPLGYPNVSTGSAGTSGGSAGSGGTGDTTGTGTTSNVTSALDAFLEGYKLRDGQVQSQGASTTTTTTNNTTNYTTTPSPVAANTTTNNYYQPAAVTVPPPAVPAPASSYTALFGTSDTAVAAVVNGQAVQYPNRVSTYTGGTIPRSDLTTSSGTTQTSQQKASSGKTIKTGYGTGTNARAV